jgi:hypothetical protein
MRASKPDEPRRRLYRAGDALYLTLTIREEIDASVLLAGLPSKE